MNNIEIKVRCPDHGAAREAAARVGATQAGVFRHTDTFFNVPGGRLKLRRLSDGGAELIFYRRDDRTGPRLSDYDVAPVTEPEKMSGLLARAFGVRGEVRKTRELWLLDNVRIHLDRVDGLGSFLELEAVVDPAHPEAACEAEVRRLMGELRIPIGDLLSQSYADMLLAEGSADPGGGG